MNTVTRRGLILSGAGLATAAFVAPAEAATGSVSLRHRQRRFHLRRDWRQRNLDLPRTTISAQSRRHQCGRLDRRLGDGPCRHRVEHSRSGDIVGIYSAIGAGLAIAGGRSNAQLSNANGVVLRLHGRQVGFSFSIDLSGMSISLA